MLDNAAQHPVSELVSVIVPSYNYGQFITHTLESLCDQSYSKWECVVVDDGSTDNTAEVVGRFVKRDNRFRFLQQENRRQAAARNNGLAHTRGEYLQFLDADDLIESRKLEQQVQFLQRNSATDIVYGDTRFFPTDRPHELLYSMYGENKPWIPGLSGSGQQMVTPLTHRNIVMVGSTLTRKSLLDRVGGFDETLPPLEDWDLWLRCAIAGARFDYQPFPETRSLVRSHRASSSKNQTAMAAAEVRLRRKLSRLLPDQASRRVNAQLLAESHGTLGAQQVLNGNRRRGIRHLLTAALCDRKIKHRLKWLACAAAAPVTKSVQFERLYRSSLTQAFGTKTS